MPPERDQIMDLVIQRIDAVERNLNKRLDQQDDELKSIHDQTKLTNGRVTALEKARERAAGVASAYSWVLPILCALLAGGLAVLFQTLK
jgi:hypothetical protein